MPYISKMDEFSEKFIFNPKNYIADFCHYKWYFGHEFGKKIAIRFSENEGGIKGPLEVWFCDPSVTLLETFWKMTEQRVVYTVHISEKLQRGLPAKTILLLMLHLWVADWKSFSPSVSKRNTIIFLKQILFVLPTVIQMERMKMIYLFSYKQHTNLFSIY